MLISSHACLFTVACMRKHNVYRSEGGIELFLCSFDFHIFFFEFLVYMMEIWQVKTKSFFLFLGNAMWSLSEGAGGGRFVVCVMNSEKFQKSYFKSSSR